MKASKFIHFYLAVPVLLFVLSAFPFQANSETPIPEPYTTIYGRVVNTWQGYNVPMEGGTVSWTFRQKYGDRKAFTYSADVECVDCNQYVEGVCADCDEYAYKLKVPQEAIASLLEPSEENIPLPDDDQLYNFAEVTVDGSPASVVVIDQYGNITPVPDEPFDILFSQERRVHYIKADLEVVYELQDSDSDGIPDYWEEKYGLNPNLDLDAAGDLDNDGWSNLDEFRNNADPTVSNKGPTLVTDNITVYEKGTTAVYLRALDSDTAPEFISYRIVAAPEGGKLLLRYGAAAAFNFRENAPVYDDLECSYAFYDRFDLSDTALNAPQSQDLELGQGSQFTQADIDAGLLVFVHEDVEAGPISFDLTVLDAESNETNATVDVAVFRPSKTDGSDAELWLDADEPGVAPDGNNMETWVGRSGNDEYATTLVTVSEISGQFTTDTSDVTIDPDLNGRNTVTTGKGNANYGMSFMPGDSHVSADSDRTLFAVFRPDSQDAGLMQLFTAPTFEMGMSGDDYPGFKGNFRYASGGQAVYSNYPVDDKWAVASVEDENGTVDICVNGMRAGGPHTGRDNPSPAGYSHLYAKSGGPDANTGIWGYSDLYHGHVAEMLVFTKVLTPLQRHRINAYLRSKWFGAVVWDATGSSRDMVMKGAYSGFSQGKYQAYLDHWGADRDHVFIGGAGNDQIHASGANNVILGMGGNDVLYGGIHRDVFVFLQDSDGDDTINRFGECDAIDLSAVLEGDGDLANYLNFTAANGNTVIGVDVDGNGSGFDDISVTLVGKTFSNDDMFRLWLEGRLVTGGTRPAFPITVEMVGNELSETSSSPLAIQIHFSEDMPAVPDGLVIPFTVGGDAKGLRNDYYIEMQAYDASEDKYVWLEVTEDTATHEFPVRLKPGDNLLQMRIHPIADTNTESREDITVAFLPNDQLYDLGPTRNFTASIVEGQDQVMIVASEPITHENHLEGGEFVISRMGGAMNQPLSVKVQIIGSAQNGVDYKYVSAEFVFAADQSEIVIPIKPYSDTTVEGLEIVELVLVDEDYYVIKGDAAAQVSIWDEKQLIGDIDLSESVTLRDPLMLMQMLTGRNDFENVIFPESSLDGDNKLTIEDVVLLLQVIAELKQL